MPDNDVATAVLLIAHGSRRAPANDDLHELAARLAGTGEWAIVEPCFLELAEPDIPAGGARCVARGAARVLMIPYFLSAGVHLRRDLTAARDELGRRHPGVAFVLAPPLGPDPALDRLVAARIRQAASAAEATPRCDAVYGACATPPAAGPSAFADPASAIDTNRAKD